MVSGEAEDDFSLVFDDSTAVVGLSVVVDCIAGSAAEAARGIVLARARSPK